LTFINLIIFTTQFSNEEAPASSQKNRSQPCLRNHTYGSPPTSLPTVPLSSTQLFQLHSLLTNYFLHTTAPYISSLSSKFKKPALSAMPSVIDQLTLSEVMINPYLRSLQLNYYYPLSSIEMSSESSPSRHPDSMRIDGESKDPLEQQPNLSLKLLAISEIQSSELPAELISEIQSSALPASQSASKPQDHPKLALKKTSHMRISLAWKSKSGNSSLRLKQDLDTLLSPSSNLPSTGNSPFDQSSHLASSGSNSHFYNMMTVMDSLPECTDSASKCSAVSSHTDTTSVEATSAAFLL
jgi:hypothetical protein